MVNIDGEHQDIVKRFQHLLFELHTCSKSCDRDCQEKGKVVKPLQPKISKINHLFLKDPAFYTGLEAFLHIFLRRSVKTHAEGIAESMGNLVEIHSDPRRGNMDIEDVGKEAMIHWNGPPLAKAEKLGREAMNRIFGRGKWNFTTLANKSDSVVTKRLRNEESNLPFFTC